MFSTSLVEIGYSGFTEEDFWKCLQWQQWWRQKTDANSTNRPIGRGELKSKLKPPHTN